MLWTRLNIRNEAHIPPNKWARKCVRLIVCALCAVILFTLIEQFICVCVGREWWARHGLYFADFVSRSFRVWWTFDSDSNSIWRGTLVLCCWQDSAFVRQKHKLHRRRKLSIDFQSFFTLTFCHIQLNFEERKALASSSLPSFPLFLCEIIIQNNGAVRYAKFRVSNCALLFQCLFVPSCSLAVSFSSLPLHPHVSSDVSFKQVHSLKNGFTVLLVLRLSLWTDFLPVLCLSCRPL